MKRKKQILFYGDSNTYGYDPQSFYGGRYPAKSRWTDILAESLRNTWVVHANGMNGRMIPSASEFSGIQHLIELHEKLDLFAVMLGTNDILFGRMQHADSPIRKMKSFLQFLTPLSSVLLIAPVPIRSDGDPAFRHFSELSKELAAGYRKLAEDYGLLFADPSGWEIELAFDNVHFTEAGNRCFADRMGEFLRKL